jgi:hypothetical protein
MAAPNIANPGDLPAHAPICFYRDFYGDATNDPFNGNYASVLQPYGIALANQNAATPVQVQELACNCRSQNVPTAFLLLHDDGKLHIYLQLDKFRTRTGLEATDWDDTMFAQKGELHHNNGQLVVWRSEYFRQVPAVIRVPLVDTIDAAFAGDADALQLGPFADDDDGTELIRVRRTCYVPPAYVPLFLAGNLSPREAWMAVQGQIVIDNRSQECSVLVDYLRAALTISGLDQPPVLAIVPPTAPLADAILLDHRRANCLEQDFPSLNAALPRLQQNQIAVELGNLVADNRTSRENDRIRRDSERVKPLSEFIGEQGVFTLLRIVGVQAEVQLPTIWNELANAKKHRRLSELQHAIDLEKERCGEPELQFIATAPLLVMIEHLAFEMSTLDSINSGFQPFRFPEQNPEDAGEARFKYESLYNGAAAPSSTDVAALMKAKMSPPLDNQEARHMHLRTMILANVLMGRNHQIPIALESFCRRFLAKEPALKRLEMTKQDKVLFPTMVSRSNALKLNNWISKRKRTAGIMAPPDLESFFDKIDEGEDWESTVPKLVLNQLGLQAYHQGGTRPPAPVSRPRESPAPSPAAADAGTVGSNARSRLNNTKFDPIFQRFKELSGISCSDLRKKIAAEKIPALPVSKVDGGPMCLAWHVRAECNQACGRKCDHVEYASTEYTDLLTWCDANFKRE